MKAVIIFILIAASVPFAAFADTPFSFWAPAGLVSCSGLSCTSLCDLIHTAAHVIYFGLTLGVFVFAPIMFAWGGITMMVAGASAEKRGSGKKMLVGTVIGIIIMLAAFLIVKTLITVLGASGAIPGFSGSGGSISCTVIGSG